MHSKVLFRRFPIKFTEVCTLDGLGVVSWKRRIRTFEEFGLERAAHGTHHTRLGKRHKGKLWEIAKVEEQVRPGDVLLAIGEANSHATADL